MIEFFPSRAVAIDIFGFSVHWYGLLYLAGFLLGFVIAQRLQKYRGIHWSSDEWSDVLTAIVLGVIVGGRLGYVLFYAPSLFWLDPLEIFKVWHGGMASHGGFIGVVLAVLWLRRKYRFDLLAFTDVIVVPIALGLALGRLGNFLNGELYGSITTLPWGMEFPGAEGWRHPTQLYAMVKDLTIALICTFHLRAAAGTKKPGVTTALFLILYAVFRFIVEHFRVQSVPDVQVGAITLTYGQVLTIPILVLGILVLLYVRRRGV